MEEIIKMQEMCQKERQYAAQVPYPLLQVEGKNLQYANLLMWDYASASSELTTITQYSYQSFCFYADPAQKELVHVLEQIAQVEMRHFRILGRLIVLLGGDPKLCICKRNRRKPWNGCMPDYRCCCVKEVLKRNIAGEEAAIQAYRTRIECIQDECVVSALKRIILDEEVHIEIFESMLCE